ncbi:hypothetical protein [Halomarina litorea]|nr:hypothetical protein [Halomarina sp. BCD28]
MVECVVCDKELDEAQMESEVEHEGNSGYVCCPTCEDEFEDSPGQYL